MNNSQKDTIMTQVYKKILNFHNKRNVFKVEGVLIVILSKFGQKNCSKITLSGQFFILLFYFILGLELGPLIGR